MVTRIPRYSVTGYRLWSGFSCKLLILFENYRVNYPVIYPCNHPGMYPGYYPQFCALLREAQVLFDCIDLAFHAPHIDGLCPAHPSDK